jgi:hydroxymethylglutaryl-CoA synthase
MGLLSIAHFHDNDKEISGTTFGFLAYGSGSKSKVLRTAQPQWKAISKSNLLKP